MVVPAAVERPGTVTHTDQANPVQVIRSYKFLMRPTSKQSDALAAMLEDHRVLYNAALEERRHAWNRCGVSVWYATQSAQLKDIRRADPDEQGRWSFCSQQATLRKLDKAFADFFRRVKAGEAKPGYPRFKGRGRFNSVVWPKNGNGCRWDSVAGPQVRVFLRGIGHVKVNQHRSVEGRIKTITAKREGKRWFIDLCCDDVPVRRLLPAGKVVGIDMGITHFLTTSDGKHVRNPRHGRAAAEALADAQRALARKKRGSSRRRKAVSRVGAHYRKIRQRRIDHAHKTALKLIRSYDLIAVENLRIKNMVRSAKGTVETPGVNVAAKGALNTAIFDAGWGCFLGILRDKAESADRVVVEVNPVRTSITCAQCGHVAGRNRRNEAFKCLSCGHETHADVNAAINILRAGLARQAARAA